MPEILNPQLKKDASRIEKFQKNPAVRISDTYVEQLKEYFTIKNPRIGSRKEFDENFKTFIAGRGELASDGRWIFYPWLQEIIHVLEKEEFEVVRFSRNNNLMAPADQKKLLAAKIGIIGLSIGSNVAIALSLIGAGSHLKIADGDSIDLSNLNRIITGTNSLGRSKVETLSRTLYMMNPYTQIEASIQRISKKDVATFVKDVNVVVDECDDFGLKIALREAASERGIAVVSGADVGRKAIVDIERYDQNKDQLIFNGRLPDMTSDEVAPLGKKEIGKLIATVIGEEHLNHSMKDSIKEIGLSIVSWPQLGTTAMANGALVAESAARIILGQQTQQRYVVALPE